MQNDERMSKPESIMNCSALPCPLVRKSSRRWSFPLRASLVILHSSLVIFSASAAIDRTKKPAPDPAPAASFPDYKTETLPNGLKVFVIEDDRKPTVTFRLVIRSGSIFDGAKTAPPSLSPNSSTAAPPSAPPPPSPWRPTPSAWPSKRTPDLIPSASPPAG